MIRRPVIPINIVVHIGEIDSGKNITVSFIEYIKNVSSGELYPNWPIEAIKANVLAIISFTLNRIYNEWYRSKGYDFDITSLPKYDQSFVEDRQFFERISLVVDDMFNNYIVRNNQVQPLFSEYCDGKITKCNGLSQWGSVSLANDGLKYLDILKRYYGNDISIVYNAEISSDILSYPGFNIRLGDAGDYVRLLKIQLNRIGKNYPAIPVIISDTVFFDNEMYNAIVKFQEIFNLKVTGVVDKTTWYKIKYLYNAVKNISSLYSEGLKEHEVELKFPNVLKLGDSGIYVAELNYYLSTISYFDNDIIFTNLGKNYDERVVDTVKAFQKKYNLSVTGVVNSDTWRVIREVYSQTISSVPSKYFTYINEFYPGYVLVKGMSGDDVLNLQRFLYVICQKFHNIPGVVVNGEFDSLTESSIKVIQKSLNLNPTGVVGANVWYNIVEISNNIR